MKPDERVLPGGIALHGVPAALRDGREVALRPVRAEDAGAVQSFVRALSPQSRHSRFFSGLMELPPYMLRRLTQPVYPKEFGLVALTGPTDACSVVGMAQYALEETRRAELSVAVADAWQRQGLGTRFVQSLIDHAARSGIQMLCAVMLANNRAMLALATRLGWTVLGNAEPGLLRIEKSLTPVQATSERDPGARSGATPPALCGARA